MTQRRRRTGRVRSGLVAGLAFLVNGGLALGLGGLARVDGTVRPDPRPARPGPLQVRLLPPTRVEEREDPASRARETPRPPRSAAAPARRDVARPSPAEPCPTPLPLTVTLDLPDLPPLGVDPATSIEAVDWNALTRAEGAKPTAGNPDETARSDPARSEPPREVYLPRPRFSDAALRRNIRHGRVVARFRVEPTGRVSRVRIQTARPRGFFELPVRRALLEARFRPALDDGVPVARWCVKCFEFRVEAP